MQKKTFKHLTLEDRVRIETLIKEGFQFVTLPTGLISLPLLFPERLKITP